MKNTRKAHLSFTLVDRHFDFLEPLLASKCYKVQADIQNCPAEIKEKLIKKKFSLRAWGTFIIELQKPEDELWQNIKKEARKVIKKTQEAGCYMELCNSEKEFKEYYRLLVSTRKAMGFKTSPYFVGLKQWRIMHPDNYQVFMIRDKEKELLAAMGVMFTQDYMVEVAAARSDSSKNRHLYANDLMKWEIIKWGNQQGIKYYDLAGVNPSPKPGSKDENIKKFKEKWGGIYYVWEFFEKYNTHSFLNKMLYTLEQSYRGKHEKEQE